MADAADDREPIQAGAEGVPSSATGPQTARRRLMLGAAAVLPSVFTLSSGAQTAVASNTRCWGRDVRIDFRHSSDAPLLSTTHDEWLRKEVYYGVHDGQPAYCALEEQALCIEPTHPGKAAIGSVWIVDGERVTVGPQTSITQISSRPQGYALVYVDREGTIATLDRGTMKDMQPVMPVTQNCWTSILGGRVSPLG